MGNEDNPKSPPNLPPQVETLRDADYVLRGYKAALYNRGSYQAREHARQLNSRLAALLGDVPREDHPTQVRHGSWESHGPVVRRSSKEEHGEDSRHGDEEDYDRESRDDESR